MDSPFKDMPSPRDTALQSPSSDGVIGHDPQLTAYPGDLGGFPICFAPIIPSTATSDLESPYNDALVQSTSTQSGNPGGDAPFDCPFTDAIAKR
jgi:hypothetical protein